MLSVACLFPAHEKRGRRHASAAGLELAQLNARMQDPLRHPQKMESKAAWHCTCNWEDYSGAEDLATKAARLDVEMQRHADHQCRSEVRELCRRHQDTKAWLKVHGVQSNLKSPNCVCSGRSFCTSSHCSRWMPRAGHRIDRGTRAIPMGVRSFFSVTVPSRLLRLQKRRSELRQRGRCTRTPGTSVPVILRFELFSQVGDRLREAEALLLVSQAGSLMACLTSEHTRRTYHKGRAPALCRACALGASSHAAFPKIDAVATRSEDDAATKHRLFYGASVQATFKPGCSYEGIMT